MKRNPNLIAHGKFFIFFRLMMTISQCERLFRAETDGRYPRSAYKIAGLEGEAETDMRKTVCYTSTAYTPPGAIETACVIEIPYSLSPSHSNSLASELCGICSEYFIAYDSIFFLILGGW
jgi:hypothetical protein